VCSKRYTIHKAKQAEASTVHLESFQYAEQKQQRIRSFDGNAG
jgi:hypothetical protein